MAKSFRMGFFVGIFCALSVPAQALSPLKLLLFQANGIAILQTGSPDISAQVAWIPTLSVGPVGVRAEIGITNLNSNGTRFFASNYEAFFMLGLLPMLTFELGGGLSTWYDTARTSPIVSVYAVMTIPMVLERIFVGYSRWLDPTTPVDEVKVGIGFNL